MELRDIPNMKPDMVEHFDRYVEGADEQQHLNDMLRAAFEFLTGNYHRWPDCRYTRDEFVDLLQRILIMQRATALAHAPLDWSIVPLITHVHLNLIDHQDTPQNNPNVAGAIYSDVVARYIHGHLAKE